MLITLPFVLTTNDVVPEKTLVAECLPRIKFADTPAAPELATKIASSAPKVPTSPFYLILIRSVRELAPSAVTENINLDGQSPEVQIDPSAAALIEAPTLSAAVSQPAK